MSAQFSINDLDLAALISSRICHDAIGPVGAIANGLEVLEDEPDEKMRDFALDTIRKSADKASAKLQFARMAFGAAGSATAEIAIGDIEHVARIFIEGERHKLIWDVNVPALGKNRVKLLLNLIAIAQSTIPIGGNIVVNVAEQGANAPILIGCQGKKARIPEGLEQLLDGGADGALDSRSIQPFYAGRLARQAGMNIHIALEGENVILQAVPA